jgi:hypothetical protein
VRDGAAAVLLAAAVATGVPVLFREARAALLGASPRTITTELAGQVLAIRSRLPRDAPLLYFDGPGDYWTSRLWKRAFYPHPVFLLHHGSWGDVWPSRAELEKKFGTRWALSAGNPPEDPGFVWRETYPPVPGSATTIWFGELR